MKILNYLFELCFIIIPFYISNTNGLKNDKNSFFTLDEAKQLNVTTCEEYSDCPKYSDKCVNSDISDNLLFLYGKKYCYVYFYCNEKGLCGNIHLNDSIGYTMCNSQDKDKDNCMYECKSDEECFTGLCKDGYCINNPNNKITICSNKENADNDEDAKIKCGKLALEETCHSNNECNSGICKNNICKEIDTDENTKYDILAIAGIVIIIVVLIIIVALKNRKNKANDESLLIELENKV